MQATRATLGTTPLPGQPKGGRGIVAVSRLVIQKRAGLFSPARSYKPTSAVGVDTLLYFSQNFTSFRCVRAVSACSVAMSAWPALPCSMASFRCVIPSSKCGFLPPLSA